MMKVKLKEFGVLTFGSVLTAVGIYFFKFQNRFVTGGISGLSLLISGLWPTLPSTATIMTILNILLLIIGFLVLGKGFGVKTAYCSLLFSALTWLLERFVPMTGPLTDETLLELIFAISLPSVGSAIIFDHDGSSGGTDIIAMIIRKYFGLDSGKALLCADIIIASMSFFVFGVRIGLFSILGLVTKSFLIDTVIDGLNLCKYFTIVTDKPEEISDFIMNDLNHTATMLAGTGAFTHSSKTLLLTACRRSEALRLRKKIREVDPEAFMFITNTSEILGKNFRSI